MVLGAPDRVNIPYKSRLKRRQNDREEHSRVKTDCDTQTRVVGHCVEVSSQWIGICAFSASLKKSRLIFAMTTQMSDHIIQAAQLDYKVNVRLAGVIDLIAAEAKYHLAC